MSEINVDADATNADLMLESNSDLNLELNEEASREMYGISRIDNERYRTHAWRVSIIRRKKRLVKNFTDKRYGSREDALIQAKEYRDQLLVKHPPISRKEFCNAKRRNNISGVTGVYRYEKPYRLRDGTVKSLWYWEANWPGDEGKSISQCFSIARYGEDKARQLATEARTKGLQTVKGTFWAAARGEFCA